MYRCPVTQPSTGQACYRHPDRITGLSCTDCGRAICPSCSIDAAVGQRCPECVRREGRQKTINMRAGQMRRSAPVTMGIIGVTVGIHLLSYLAPGLWQQVVENLAMWNRGVAAGEWWRMITVVAVHANLMHIAFNMLALYSLGPQIERELGGVRLSALYVASAAGGSAFAYLLGSPNDFGVGASGAIFGLFGVWMASAVRRRNTAHGRYLLGQLGGILAINAAIPFIVRNVSWQAHVGGLVAGFVIGQIWAKARGESAYAWHLISAALMTLAAFAVVLT